MRYLSVHKFYSDMKNLRFLKKIQLWPRMTVLEYRTRVLEYHLRAHTQSSTYVAQYLIRSMIPIFRRFNLYLVDHRALLFHPLYQIHPTFVYRLHDKVHETTKSSALSSYIANSLFSTGNREEQQSNSEIWNHYDSRTFIEVFDGCFLDSGRPQGCWVSKSFGQVKKSLTRSKANK